MEAINDILNKLAGVDPLVWAVLGGYLAPYAHEALKKVTDFGEKANYLVALLVIPGLIAVLTGVSSPELLAGLHPLLQLAIGTAAAAIVSQLKYGLSLRPKVLLKRENARLNSQLNPPAPSFLDAETPVGGGIVGSVPAPREPETGY
jgi:predicted PurR-regulated permease PerM